MTRSGLFTAVVIMWCLGPVAFGETIVGEVRMWGGAIADTPNGWLMCDGSEVSRITYADLFATIGTIYGAGDGSTTFNLPDFRDRSPMRVTQDDAGVPKTNVSGTLEQIGGESTHVLGVDEMPSHTHQVTTYDNNAGGPDRRVPQSKISVTQLITLFTPTTSAGGDQPHNNLHRYFAVTYIIAATLPGPVPTVSQWGLVVMVLLLLTAATAIFARRRGVVT